MMPTAACGLCLLRSASCGNRTPEPHMGLYLQLRRLCLVDCSLCNRAKPADFLLQTGSRTPHRTSCRHGLGTFRQVRLPNRFDRHIEVPAQLRTDPESVPPLAGSPIEPRTSALPMRLPSVASPLNIVVGRSPPDRVVRRIWEVVQGGCDGREVCAEALGGGTRTCRRSPKASAAGVPSRNGR